VALAAAAVSFVAVRWFVLPQFGAQRQAPLHAPAPQLPLEGAPTTAPPTPPPDTDPGTTAKAQDLELPEGIVLEDAGLIEVVTESGALVYVDGNFVGAGPLRRVPVGPGSHSVRVGQGVSAQTHSVEVRVGRRSRLDLARAAGD
jgi:hypothetical protein